MFCLKLPFSGGNEDILHSRLFNKTGSAGCNHPLKTFCPISQFSAPWSSFISKDQTRCVNISLMLLRATCARSLRQHISECRRCHLHLARTISRSDWKWLHNILLVIIIRRITKPSVRDERKRFAKVSSRSIRAIMIDSDDRLGGSKYVSNNYRNYQADMKYGVG